MSKTIWLGAVAYDPKVVTIWEGMRRYFHEEAHLPVEVVLFQSYEAQVGALLAQPDESMPHIDIAWNTNLAWLQSDEWSGHACRAVAMRDTDLGWMTKLIAVAGGPVSTPADLRNRTVALGSRDSGHAAILPVHFLEELGMREGQDYRTLRFNTDLGKAKALGKEFSIEAQYSDAAAMLEREALDFVDIVTTPPSHRRLVTLAAPYVQLIICQKPFAESLEDADAMVEACEIPLG